MHSAVILADENKKLRTENERQKKKRCVRRQYITTGGVLTIQEGLDRINSTDLGANSEVVEGVEEHQTRALRTCSLCRSLTHTARTCQLKGNCN
jgi:hypothetical protein